MITPAQKSKLLRFIKSSDVCPSYGEIKAHLGFGSKSQVARLLDTLEMDGSIRRLRSRARAIEVVWPPQDRRQFFRFDEKTKELVQFTPVSRKTER